ncbi:MAG: CDP-alcohol phosphatidyltransferase family protein [Myxococcales bacterium]|nr:CDP-alcohol phosphatidyltransferase family protein [Myxococcales bacterium]
MPARSERPIQRPGVVEIYRRSLKPQDLRFNNWACRPLAAVFVWVLFYVPITPNQITFLSLFVALLADAALLFCPGYTGLWSAAVLLYLAFVLDCTDGQLARLRSQTSSVGSYLDFLMDEIKAVALIAAVAGRLAIDRSPVPSAELLATVSTDPRVLWLCVGLCGVVFAASGISITTFMRRPEYFEAVHGKQPEKVPGFTALRAKDEAAPAAPPSLIKRLVLLPIRILEWLGKLTLHYPAWFYIPALLGHIEWFLLPYLAAHTLYLGRSGLIVLVRLGRPARVPSSP